MACYPAVRRCWNSPKQSGQICGSWPATLQFYATHTNDTPLRCPASVVCDQVWGALKTAFLLAEPRQQVASLQKTLQNTSGANAPFSVFAGNRGCQGPQSLF